MNEPAPICADCGGQMVWQPCIYEAAQVKDPETFVPCDTCKGAGAYWLCPAYSDEVAAANLEVRE